MPLWPSFAQVMDFAARSVRLNAPGVRMSGRGAPFLIPMPTPERAMAGCDAASILPCFARSAITAGGGGGEAGGGVSPRLDLALRGGGEAERDDEPVAGLALEGGRELVQRLLH